MPEMWTRVTRRRIRWSMAGKVGWVRQSVMGLHGARSGKENIRVEIMGVFSMRGLKRIV